MFAPVNELTRSLFGKDSADAVSVDDLQHLSTHYPWFALGQFLLASKLKSTHSPQYARQLERATLYFHDPLWLDTLLDDSKNVETTVPASSKNEVREEVITTPVHTELETPTTVEELVVQHEVDEEVADELPLDDNGADKPINFQPIRFDPIATNKNELTFEPYHTVDYFASVGIRYKEEAKPEDRFSRQLKSFTEWLKEMRKAPATEQATAVASVDEKKVEQMAETSIVDREVVTEAMADVWEQQGEHDKATDIYRKLSLLDPSKSSYFAAKIDHLKQS